MAGAVHPRIDPKARAMSELAHLFEEFYPDSLSTNQTAGHRFKGQKEIFYVRVRELVEQLQEPAMPESLPERIHGFLATNLHRRPTLKDLSEFLGYSEKYSSDFFKAMMGEPFSQYRKRLRLQRAYRLLTERQATLAEIADSLGFSDQFAFSHFFKRANGCAPNEFRLRLSKTSGIEAKAC